tara:strand:- start:2781 stop:2954 length:174 start_codon:yes stop_codon:yes gene_type:complete
MKHDDEFDEEENSPLDELFMCFETPALCLIVVLCALMLMVACGALYYGSLVLIAWSS